MDEKDEKVNADAATYSKLYSMLGGPLPILMFGVQNIFFRIIEVYKETI